jgi:hypothetical protein
MGGGLMNKIQKYFARLEFRNKILISDAQSFEDLFTEIMSQKLPSFQPVKPQGRLGDMKNDGYVSSSGQYFQVYGPENIESKIHEAIAKITTDANGLVQHWQGITEIVYVVNDKFKGANVTVHQLIQELTREITKLGEKLNVQITLWTARQIENAFLELSDEQMTRIISPSFLVVDPCYDIDYASLSEVVKYIAQLPFNHTDTTLRAPKFEEKIVFNNLSEQISTRLNAQYLNNTEIKDYFDRNGGYLADTLRDRFASLYQEAKSLIVDDCTNNDYMYIYIRRKACPENAGKAFVENVESLMAYYFEACDIFEEPKVGVTV